MRTKKTTFLLAISSLLIISCANETNTEVAEKAAEPCLYNYDGSSTSVEWTAFKFTEKKGVGGKFEKVNVLISEPAVDMFQTLTGASFTIPVETVNSENEDRDAKIQAHLFGSMEATEVISGLVKSIGESEAVVELTMNGVSHDYSGAVTVEGETISFSSTIDLTDFDAKNSVDSLNTVCDDLHKGADGISKLWTEVDIKVQTTLKKVCP